MKSNPAPLFLGIDMGGTNTAFGLVTSAGEIIGRGSIPTRGFPNFQDYVKGLSAAVRELAERLQIPLASITAAGIGAPCINSENGVIEGAVNLPWESPLPIGPTLSESLGCIPVFGENDANVAALGELHFGTARGLKNFIMLTLGTGVGGAVVCDGRLLHGKRGLAAELGHVRIRHGEDARKCNCGRKGCLDRYASASGLILTARKLIQNTLLPSKLRDPEPFSAQDIGKLASEGDPLALEALRLTGEILGEACAEFTAFSSPEAIIFFGGVANSFPYFSESLRETYDKNLLWVYNHQTKFMKSALAEADAAILGAAAIAKDRG